MLETHCFIYGNWARMRPGTSGILLNIILILKKQTKKSGFGPQTWIFNSDTPLTVYFSSITHFLYPLFSNPHCRKGSYGPYGPCWFSAENHRHLLSTTLPTWEVWRKIHFHVITHIHVYTYISVSYTHLTLPTTPYV